MGVRLTMRQLVCTALLLSCCLGCERGATTPPASSKASAASLRVVATTNIAADLVRALAPSDVVVDCLMGPGIDPHLYKASQGDVARLFSADVIVYNGLHLEGKMAEIFEQLASKKLTTIALANGIATEHLIAIDGGAYDPHIWMDVKLWYQAAEYLTQQLSLHDKARAPAYAAQFLRYSALLQALDDELRQQAQRLPAARRILITAHDAFAYFGRAYGFQVHGLLGVSTVAEASTADVRALADLIVTTKIPAIFVESTLSDRYLKSLQEAVASQGGSVVLGGQLFADALSDAQGPAGTYLTMMRSNMQIIVTALGG